MFAGNKIIYGLLISLGLCTVIPVIAADGVVVVANLDTPALNEDDLQRIYMGKVVEINGRPIVPVNLNKGNTLRSTFMQLVMAQDDDKFIAYWTVRRYIGKGTPPREFATVEAQMDFLRATPGAVGYVDESTDNRRGVKTLLKRP